jgi:hypothetical protein
MVIRWHFFLLPLTFARYCYHEYVPDIDLICHESIPEN